MPNFNHDQISAIRLKDGPALIIAGPGSGKTTVIVHRIAELTLRYGISEEEILAITFTKAAAEEMRVRYLRQMGKTKTEVGFGTMHSVFLNILKTYFKNFKAELVSPKVSSETIRDIYFRKYSQKVGIDMCANFLNKISSFKNGKLRNDPFIRSLAKSYDRCIHQKGLLDFDDMIILCLKALKSSPYILEKIRNKHKYIIVDEFQDLNLLQFEALKLISAPLNNIFAVGDDDQSIYTFRGAQPSIMLSFAERFKNTSLIRLVINYRCDYDIVKHSSKLISKNLDRYDKQLRANSKNPGKITVCGFASYEEAAASIVNIVKGLDQNISVAILYRTHRSGSKICSLVSQNSYLNGHDLSMLTFHASKGQEFDMVFIIGANEGITPAKCEHDEEMEEERRMFYVAMTRARHFLHIYYTKSTYIKHEKSSRFIKESGLGSGFFRTN